MKSVKVPALELFLHEMIPLAKAMGVPRTRVERIAAETSGITADTALRLSKALGTSAQLWLNLQNRYDVETAQRAIGKQIDKIKRVTSDAAA